MFDTKRFDFWKPLYVISKIVIVVYYIFFGAPLYSSTFLKTLLYVKALSC